MELVPSAGARTRLAELRARFPFLGAGVATSFEANGGTTLRALIPTESKRSTAHAASVDLPMFANGAARLEDDRSDVSVRFVLRDARTVPPAVADGIALFAGALGGADLLHRVHREGTEDFVVFEQKPPKEEIAYDVDVSQVAGLRLVQNTLEFLDRHGAPRLRVAPPYVVGADGRRLAATLAVTGCAYDVDAAGPWGRPVTRPGAATCVVRVAWCGTTTYPAVLDPAWVTTGSMTAARSGHSASLLGSGRVLIAGGDSSTGYMGAELYDPGTGTFAATGSMMAAHLGHTAPVLASGKVLVGGTSDAELYNPGTGTFAATARLIGMPAGSTASVLASSAVLLAGFSDAALYDPVTESFAATGSMTTRRDGNYSAAVLATGKVLVAGGLGGGGHSTFTLPNAELYEPASGTFTATGSMVRPREFHTASALATGKVLIAGGVLAHGAPPSATAELYDPAAGTFSSTGSMTTARAGHTARLLRSGKVLVAGGSSINYASNSAELYDPANGTFTAIATMTELRSGHSMTLLPSGRVLVAGGTNGVSVLQTAEILSLGQNGDACSVGDDCVTGVCDDGVCCGSPCGTCATCTPGTGACTRVVGRDDPDTCTGATTCDAAGACKLRIGEACPGGRSSCASGFCVDGFCCDTACDAGCDSCNLADNEGRCSVAAVGDPGASPSCSPYRCNGQAAACPASCARDVDCVTDTTCDLATKKCVAAATCDGDHTTSGPTGPKDCSPYKCDNSGTCKPSCASVDDCVAPGACDPGGKCVLPTAGAESGGCSVALSARAGAARRSNAVWFAFLTTLAALARRRRRSVGSDAARRADLESAGRKDR